MPSRPPMLLTLTITPEPRASMRGSTARVMRAGAMKLTRIVVSTSSTVSRAAGRRLGMAALFTSTSSPPKASHASRASASAPSTSSRSTTQWRQSGLRAQQSARTASSLSRRRATIPTVAPRATMAFASAAPMPDDAPVISAVAPSTSIGSADRDRSFRAVGGGQARLLLELGRGLVEADHAVSAVVGVEHLRRQRVTPTVAGAQLRVDDNLHASSLPDQREAGE